MALGAAWRTRLAPSRRAEAARRARGPVGVGHRAARRGRGRRAHGRHAGRSTSRGYTVHEASSGVEALEIYNELDGKIDIVVSDVVMPEMDGPTLLGELRKTPGPTSSSSSSPAMPRTPSPRTCRRTRSSASCPKPFSLKQLATVVKEVLEGE